MRKKILTLLALSAVTLMLLATAASPLLLLFSNPLLLQPAQAQTPITFRTPTPAVDPNLTTTTLTFDAQGTLSSDSTEARITNGTFQVTDTRSGQTLYNGSINSGGFTNSTDGENIYAFGDLDYPAGGTIGISTSCSASINNDIQFQSQDFSGPVECSNQGGGNTTSSMTGPTTAQDSDGDGIPDSSDSCTHNSNPRCFKEDTTTQQQSSTPIAGNQTR